MSDQDLQAKGALEKAPDGGDPPTRTSAATTGTPAGTPAQATVIKARRDWHGMLARRLAEHWELAGSRFSGLVMRVKALYWGVQFGPHCRFFGPMLLSRKEGSSLVVGQRCIFRSGYKSNQVGLNRPCSFSAMSMTARVKVGDYCAFSGTVIASSESITLGDRVVCGGNTTITDTDWHGLHPSERRNPGRTAPVVLEDDVFLGLGVTVLKGVTIGHGTFVAAGSVVTRSLPPMVLAAGNPARVIREL